MLRNKKICFRTCFRAVYIPISFVDEMAAADYTVDPNDGSTHRPASFRQAFEHWLLCEILGAIGGHTVM